jgi:hypothetical protein
MEEKKIALIIDARLGVITVVNVFYQDKYMKKLNIQKIIEN